MITECQVQRVDNFIVEVDKKVYVSTYDKESGVVETTLDKTKAITFPKFKLALPVVSWLRKEKNFYNAYVLRSSEVSV